MIGERIKKLREQKGFSLSELAELAHVSKSYLSGMERDLNKNPSIHLLLKVAKPLDVSIVFLLTGLNQEELDLDNNDIKNLDPEWKKMIEKAIEDGINKDDFKEYISYIKFKIWEKANN
ncbi:helix-turn-helix domain-containing protein [Neobacillus sp. YIM B06451]|uniref:helix-turn-helix domain-containing protein n=1 Tax=Neobacillus sp. YIM B06451 TaxID=3070994 RepID=UPI00292E81E8|nr:helix-turn-helix domain-containing protein [Neobacillus sp. YIM B06451]